MIEHVDRTAFKNGAGKEPRRHVRTPPGFIDGEIAQAGRRQAEQVAIAVRHQFIRLLGGGVETDRVIHFVMNRERHPGVGADA